MVQIGGISVIMGAYDGAVNEQLDDALNICK